MIEGKKKLVELLGFPTANIQINESYKLLPKMGFYIVSSEINDILYFGMMNIGNNPTLGENEQSIEVHYFDMSENIYNEKIKNINPRTY